MESTTRVYPSLVAIVFYAVIIGCSSNPTSTPVPSHMAADTQIGTRDNDVGYDGDAQWMADITGDGRADYVYNNDGTKEYNVLVANDDLPYGTGGLGADTLAGTRTDDVNYDGKSQWLADVNGDGRADFVYNKNKSSDYRVMISKGDGTFDTDAVAGSRNSNNNVGYGGKAAWMADVNGDSWADVVYNRDNYPTYWVMLAGQNNTGGFIFNKEVTPTNSRTKEVGFSGKAQWLADVNGDGRADFVYNVSGSHDYRVMLGQADGTFGADNAAGSRNSNNNVGFSGEAQWMEDVTGDGRADYVYNRDNTYEYWVMVAKTDGTFDGDQNWGNRNENNKVGYGIYGQGLTDLNGDGVNDFMYNRDNTKEYWAMLSIGSDFSTDQLWGSRSPSNDIAENGKAAFLVDITGDGIGDIVYNRNGTDEIWMTKTNTPDVRTKLVFLDVWGEGYNPYGPDTITGFSHSFNLNRKDMTPNSGPNVGKPIPNFIPVDSWDNPVFPIADGAVQIMTVMGSPINTATANQMYRTIDKNNGIVILFGYDEGVDSREIENFENVFIRDHGWVNVSSSVTLGYPFTTIKVGNNSRRTYADTSRSMVLSIGVGSRVGGAGMADSDDNEFSGGGIVHDEL